MTRRTVHLTCGLLLALASSVHLMAQDPTDPTPAKPQGRGTLAPAAKAGAPAAAEPTASAEEIRKLLEDNNPREALQKLSKVLALKGDAAKAYDKHELLRLKAESHLKLKDTSAAASAFAAAGKAAADEAAGAEDKAAEMVVKRSKNLTFTPKVGKKGEKPQPIDISDPEKRKAAYAAMLEEEKVEAEPRIKAARTAKSLPPIAEALKVIGDVRMLELAATGDSKDASAQADELTGRAHKLMNDAVQKMADTVKAIETSANDVKEVAVPTRGPNGTGAVLMRSYKRRGLSTRDTQDLKQIIGDLKKLVPMARGLSESLGDAGKQFAQVADDGAAVGNKADEVLRKNYDDEMDLMRRDTQLRRPIERR